MAAPEPVAPQPAVPATSWRTYLNGRTVAILFLGFSSGLPLYTLIYLMQAWLATSGLDVKALGLFASLTTRQGGWGRVRGWNVVVRSRHSKIHL